MTLREKHRVFWRVVVCLLGVGILAVSGCSSFVRQEVEPMSGAPASPQPEQLWEVPYAQGRVAPAESPPPVSPRITSQPARPPSPSATDRLADTGGPITSPYALNTKNIIRLMYEKGPLVASVRESMVAAQHGLEEFRANLSRFEPFVESSADVSRFPERRDSRGVSSEVVGGVEKETFDGAVIRLEGGASADRVEFGDVEVGEDPVDKGSGGLIRARLEVPFAGSRKRQDRIISQAFQESRARQAVLSYLTSFRSYTRSVLTYYQNALYYLEFVRICQRKLDRLETLMGDDRVRPTDLPIMESSSGDAKVLLETYREDYRTSVHILLQYLGITPDEAYALEESPLDAPSRYYERTLTREGREQMLAEAYENNPQFQVLEDAIKDSELKRSQAILGKHDITAFAEGTQFAFGAETYDNRVGGWQLSGGVTFRMNDQRVLTASRKKAEAEIQGFRAQIAAEQLSIQRQIATQSSELRSRIESRAQILENIKKAKTLFEERSRIYLNGGRGDLTVDDMLAALGGVVTAETRLTSNAFYCAQAENELMAATGELYRIVGLKMKDNGNGVDTPVTE